uniref:NADH dehydrogenase subunit 6 n=1 Tax=Gastraspis sp. ZJUH_2016016 TaxID=2491177 RepID=A0A3Q8UA26_9HYME|nr:NADH dehydrogenase subunit 6 [Gastraspis sp. ZJUH_2016016]
MSLMNLFMIFFMSMMLLFMLHFNNIHPLMVGLVLLLLSIIVSLQMNLFNKSSIFSMIMYLIVIGGFLILFLYFNSFVLNMKMFFNIESMILCLFNFFLYFMLLILLMFKFDYLNYMIFLNNKILEMKNLINLNELNQSDFNKIFLKLSSLMVFGMLYLFYVLVVIVKIIFFYNPKSLRKLLYEDKSVIK